MRLYRASVPSSGSPAAAIFVFESRIVKRRTELAATRARRGVHRPAVQELEWTRTRVS